MPEISKRDLHSEEIQELMGFIPKGIVRWGLSIIFIILVGIIIGSYYFKLPEIITAPVILTTQNPPVALLSKSTGKIERLFVQDKQNVYLGTILALINNPTNYQDYLLLKSVIEEASNISTWDAHVKSIELPNHLTLGELQSSYSAFLKTRSSFRYYLSQNLIPQKICLLKKQIIKQQEYYRTQLKQKSIQTKDLILSVKSFERDSLLFVKQATSESEFEKSRQALLAKKSASIGFDASLKNIESSILQLQEKSLELEMQFEKDLAQFRLDLDESKQNLFNLVNQWEEKYIVRSPVNGIITFTSVWSENQEVRTGDLVATIIPEGEMTIIAKSTIPAAGFGKVEVGQIANIKLAGFPYMQFGMIKGRIRSVSLVPEEKGYVAEIELIDGMTSSYKTNLKFIQEMDGTAEIITKDIRLIFRLIDPLRALFDNYL